MTVLIIIMIILGCLFVAASFMVSEKLSAKDVETMKEVTKSHIEVLIKDRMADASVEMEEQLSQKIDEAMDKLEAKTDKEIVEKIMEITDYSKSVIDTMEKARSEVNFIYAMLGDKQETIKKTTSDIQDIQSRLGQINDSVEFKMKELRELIEKHDQAMAYAEAGQNSSLANNFAAIPADLNPEVSEPLLQLGVEEQEVLSEEPKKRGRKRKVIDDEPIVQPQISDKHNANMEILNLHDEGLEAVEIARRLGIGLGEVKLVLGLYLGEN